MAQGCFFSRQQGWINYDSDIKPMRVYISPTVHVDEKYMSDIRGMTGASILTKNLPLPLLNNMAACFYNWYWYPCNTQIGCFTRM